MKRYLALDIGLRRTGVACSDSDSRIALPQKTIQHSSVQELGEAVLEIIKQRHIDTVVIGLPLLLSGEEGAQSTIVRDYVDQISFPSSVELVFLDERYTTPREKEIDPDAAAACHLLHVHLDREISGKS